MAGSLTGTGSTLRIQSKSSRYIWSDRRSGTEVVGRGRGLRCAQDDVVGDESLCFASAIDLLKSTACCWNSLSLRIRAEIRGQTLRWIRDTLLEKLELVSPS